MTSDRVGAAMKRGQCRECGCVLGAGYLCDDCDTVEGWDDV